MKNSDKREEIMQAALELIAEHGFHGAPMAMVADRAGVGAGTIYRYFESKDVLIAEIFSELERKMVESLMQGYSRDRSLRERFIYLSTMIIRYFMANAVHFRFIEQYMNSPYGVSLRRERLLGEARDIDLFRHLLQEGIDRQAVEGPAPLPALCPGFRAHSFPSAGSYPGVRGAGRCIDSESGRSMLGRG